MVRIPRKRSLNMAKLVLQKDLAYLRNKKIPMNSKIGLSTGVFDVLSPGIIEHLREARKKVDALIIGVVSDKYSKHLNPTHDEEERIALISAVSYVDYVFVLDAGDSIHAIIDLKPTFFIRGTIPKLDREKETYLKEIEEVRKQGGRPLMSTQSRYTNADFILFSNDLKTYLQTVDRDRLIEELEKCLSKLSNLRVLAIGETIIDQYTMVNPLGKSSKDPLLAFELKNTSILPGGILSIADTCANWVTNVSVITFVRTVSDLNSITNKVNKNIDLRVCELPSRPTIVKHRYVDSASGQKVFEYYDFSDKDLTDLESNLIKSKGLDMLDFDLVLIADYGHGLFTSSVRDWLASTAKFLVVNTQANAGNRGYNTISKYDRCDFFSLNSSELHLELRNRNPDYTDVVPQVLNKLNAQGCVLTLGGSGVMVFDEQGFTHAPALAKLIVDKVGAGDALFAISSLLACTGASKELIALLGNIVAAFEVSQLGHHSSLNLQNLRDCALSVLGESSQLLTKERNK